jgi:Papain fold toxin 1, glutamine deamidase
VSLFVGAGEANAAIKGGSIAGKAAKVASKAEKVAGAANVAGKLDKATEVGSLADKAADAGKAAQGADEVAKASPKAKTPKAETRDPQAAKSKVEAITRIEAGGIAPKKRANQSDKAVPETIDGGVRRQVSLDDMRYSQGDVSSKMSLPNGEKVPIDTVVGDMRTNGFPNDAAPTVVEHPNGELVTLDHRRLVAADKAGIKEVPAKVFSANERLPQQQILKKRFRLKTAEPITDPRTGKVYHPGDVAETYGEAALIRSANQRMLRDEAGHLLYPDFPLEGSPKIPDIQTPAKQISGNTKERLSEKLVKYPKEVNRKIQAGNSKVEFDSLQTHDVHPDNINPGWKNNPHRKYNCVNCSIATDSTLKGKPASALPSQKTELTVLEDMYGAKAKRMKSEKEIVSVMSKLENGKTGIVYVIYGEIPPFAHVFNVKNVKGKVNFYDGQTGATNTELFENVVHMRLLHTN